jgi:hypothetical protein
MLINHNLYQHRKKSGKEACSKAINITKRGGLSKSPYRQSSNIEVSKHATLHASLVVFVLYVEAASFKHCVASGIIASSSGSKRAIPNHLRCPCDGYTLITSNDSRSNAMLEARLNPPLLVMLMALLQASLPLFLRC